VSDTESVSDTGSVPDAESVPESESMSPAALRWGLVALQPVQPGGFLLWWRQQQRPE
jgi:hypothetical protein